MEWRAEAVRQILASWAIEGFKADTFYLALAERYISGEITTAQMRCAIIAHYSSVSEK